MSGEHPYNYGPKERGKDERIAAHAGLRNIHGKGGPSAEEDRGVIVRSPRERPHAIYEREHGKCDRARDVQKADE